MSSASTSSSAGLVLAALPELATALSLTGTPSSSGAADDGIVGSGRGHPGGVSAAGSCGRLVPPWVTAFTCGPCWGQDIRLTENLRIRTSTPAPHPTYCP